MRTAVAFISICVLLCISYSCSGKSTEQTKEIETEGRSIYPKYDSSGESIPFLVEIQ
jgi:hypothetical protein